MKFYWFRCYISTIFPKLVRKNEVRFNDHFFFIPTLSWFWTTLRIIDLHLHTFKTVPGIDYKPALRDWYYGITVLYTHMEIEHHLSFNLFTVLHFVNSSPVCFVILIMDRIFHHKWNFVILSKFHQKP